MTSTHDGRDVPTGAADGAGDGAAPPAVPHSVAVAFRVLEAVAETQPAGVSELARKLGLAKSTVHRSLRALEALHYVFQSTTTASWSLTLRPYHVGARASVLSLRDLARPAMEALRDRTDESIGLGALEGSEVVILAIVEGRQAVRAYVEVGDRYQAHTASMGRAILAASPDEVVERVLDVPARVLTPNSITDPDDLRREIERTRERGYAVNAGERRADVTSVGAAIVGADGRVLGAMAITAPSVRVQGDRVAEFGRLVADGAARVASLAGG